MTYSQSKYFVFTIEYLIPLCITVLVCLLLYLSFISSLFQIKSIECYLDLKPCENPHLLADLAHLKGQNIFLVDPPALIKRLTRGDYQIRNGQVTKNLPGMLTLNLNSVYPILALQVGGDSDFATIDSQYRVIQFTSTFPNVPIISLSKPASLTVSQVITDEQLLSQLRLTYSLVQSVPGIKSISILDQNITIILNDGLLALFTSQRDLEDQISALQGLRQDGTIIQGVREIDLRFSQPILRKD